METTAVINVAEALSRGEKQVLVSIRPARLFLQESPKEAAAVRATLERQDCAGLTAAAHKLKGSVIRMSAPRLFEYAKRLEELRRQGELAEASSVCADVKACLAEVHDALRKLIAGGFPS
jgi:HPt (histidine-containing phosphotransfer) domain-containing protein